MSTQIELLEQQIKDMAMAFQELSIKVADLRNEFDSLLDDTEINNRLDNLENATDEIRGEITDEIRGEINGLRSRLDDLE